MVLLCVLLELGFSLLVVASHLADVGELQDALILLHDKVEVLLVVVECVTALEGSVHLVVTSKTSLKVHLGNGLGARDVSWEVVVRVKALLMDRDRALVGSEQL